MATIHFEFDVEHWIAGAGRFRGQFGGNAQEAWEGVLEEIYDESQDIVHVVTGSLKFSGRTEVFFEDDELVGAVVYGGASSPNFVDYASQEFSRGGSHDFLTPAFVKHADEFGPATIEAYEDTMESWR